MRVLKMIKRRQGAFTYIIENVDMTEDPRPLVQAANEEITAELGEGVAWDAAQNGSRSHRSRRYWQNVVPEAALRYQLSRMERPKARLVADILEPGQLAAPVTHTDHPAQYPCNKVGEPRQAWPTMVAFERARGFMEVNGVAGPGMVFDQAWGEWEESTTQERELAMGFLAGATACPQMTEKEMRGALGRALDLNALHWLITTMDFDMDGDYFDPPDWPPIGPVHMSLDLTPEGAAAEAEGGRNGQQEGVGKVTIGGQEVAGPVARLPAWDIGEGLQGSQREGVD
ncbi:unnamed protein product [Closterium sp. Naga37s-1]|nr:unnamed protein product [Closterium sp. Naga37s-1]